MDSKDMLRRTVRSRAESYGESLRDEVSFRIMETVGRSPAFAAAGSVALYWSLPSEVATQAFVEKWAARKRIFLPVMQGEGLVLRRFSGRSGLQRARFGIGEPAAGEETGPDGVDLIVVPGVGYDPYGNRLGHGKGFYDRLLTRGGPLKVGVCFGYQFFENVPAGPHDVPVDWVVCGSEREVRLYSGGILQSGWI